MERVTKWYEPNPMTDGKYGRTTQLEWLEFEKERYENLHKRVEIRPHPTTPNLYALFVDNSNRE